MKSSNGDNLKEHKLVGKLVKDGEVIDHTIIKGYVGKSSSDKKIRVYLNLRFNQYVEVNKTDILHAEEVAEDEMEFGGTCMWIRKDAEMNFVTSITQKAQFIEGQIVQSQLRLSQLSRLYGGLALANTGPVSCGPILSIAEPGCPQVPKSLIPKPEGGCE